jgi:type II secretory pathway component GspD/PulD (secretin)
VKKVFPVLFLVFAILLCQGSLFAQDEKNFSEAFEEKPASRTAIVGLEGNISLDLRDIDVVEALKFLAMKAGINIVTTKAVTGRVTLRVEDVSVKDIFDVMLRANKLAYEKRDNIYSVMTEEEYKGLYGAVFADVRQVQVFDLTYAIPEQIFNLCDTLKSDVGRVLVSPESGRVVVMDSPDKLKLIEEAIRSFEKENIVKVFTINYANAKDVAEQLKAQLEAKNVGFVKADERSNQVIVQTLAERMKTVEELIERLDRKTREVLIETKIIRVNFKKEVTEEVEWEGLFEVIWDSDLTYLGSTPFASVQTASDAWRSRRTVLEGGLPPDGDERINPVDYVGAYAFSGTSLALNTSQPSTGGDEIHVGIVGNHDFDVAFRAFRDIGEAEIVSTPKITVANNQEAKIHVGEKQAYVTSTTTTGQTTSTVSEEVTFVDVGTQLFVTPNINEEGYITLKVKTEVSNVVNVLVTPTNNRIPIIGTSVAETTVMSRSGSTIVIAGLRGKTKGFEKKTTPILGDLPFIGKFFTSNKPMANRTEILILITPVITSGDALVDSRGRPVGETFIKPEKDYTQSEAVKEASSSGVLTTQEGIKGLKVDE